MPVAAWNIGRRRTSMINGGRPLASADKSSLLDVDVSIAPPDEVK
jgi:hypothetical protein